MPPGSFMPECDAFGLIQQNSLLATKSRKKARNCGLFHGPE
jgi:hypothetical protein